MFDLTIQLFKIILHVKNSRCLRFEDVIFQLLTQGKKIKSRMYVLQKQSCKLSQDIVSAASQRKNLLDVDKKLGINPS